MGSSSPEEAREPGKELLERARRGDASARSELLKQAWPVLYRWALVRTADPDEAKDLAQEGAIRVLRKLDTFRGDSSFSTWSYRIVRNMDLDRRQARARRAARERAYVAPDVRETAGPDPERSVDRARLLARVSTSFGKLTERQRTVFAMVELEGRTAAEVAEILEVAPSTVRVTLLRARRLVRNDVLRSDPELVKAFCQ